MDNKKAFTKSDVLIALGCVVFLLMNLGALGRMGRSKAKDVVCRVNLKQWGNSFASFAADHEGYNPYGGWAHFWWWFMLPYIEPDAKSRHLFLCPMAVKGDVQPFRAWDYGTAPWGGRYIGSYGVNPWIFSRTDIVGSMFGGINPPEWRWRRCNVSGAQNIPVFGDCASSGAGGRQNDMAPESRDSGTGSSDRRGIGVWCVDRHDCAMNMLYMDWSVRRTPLKCLWKIKWHRNYDTTNAEPPNAWPEWMDECADCD
jgi:hypothetical protein